MSPLSYLCSDCNVLKPYWQYAEENSEHVANKQQKRCDTCCKKKCSTCNEWRSEFHFSSGEWKTKDFDALCFPCYREEDTRMMPYFYCSYCKDLLQAKYFVSPVRGQHNGVCYPCMTRERRHARRRNFTLSPHPNDSFHHIHEGNDSDHHITCRQCHRTKAISHFSKKKGLKQHLCLDCLPIITCGECNMEKPPSQYTTDDGQEKRLCDGCVKTPVSPQINRREPPQNPIPISPNETKAVENELDQKISTNSTERLEYSLTCCNCHAQKPLSQLKQSLCSICLPKTTIICSRCNIEKRPSSTEVGKKDDICDECVLHAIKSQSSSESQINQDGLTTRCKKCNEEKSSESFSYDSKDKKNNICNDCKMNSTCVQCNKKHPMEMYSKKEWPREKSTCKLCKDGAMIKWKKCLECNIEKNRDDFSKREWKKEKGTCSACAATQMKKCLDCNIEKTRNTFRAEEWEKDEGRCNACAAAQTKKCLDCNNDKLRCWYSNNEWNKDKSTCVSCDRSRRKKCLDCNIKKTRDRVEAEEWKKDATTTTPVPNETCTKETTEMQQHPRTTYLECRKSTYPIYLACCNCNKQKPLSQLKEPLCSACLSAVICTKCNVKKPTSAYTTIEGKEKSVCNDCSLHSIKESFSDPKNDDVRLSMNQSPVIDNVVRSSLNQLACNNDKIRNCFNNECNIEKDHVHFSDSEWYKKQRKCDVCVTGQMKQESTDASELQLAIEAVHSVSPKEEVNETPAPENLASSVVEIESTTVSFSMDEESRKRPREDCHDAEIGNSPKAMKQSESDDKADNTNISSSTSQGSPIRDELQLVLFRCTKESMWWPALATTSMKKLIIATKLNTKQKIEMLKMNIEALKSNTKQQDRKLIYVSRFLSQHHPEDQQPMHIISKDEQHDLICDFIDESVVCVNEEGPRGRAVDLAILWRFDNEDDTVELVERDTNVCSEALQTRIDKAAVQICNHEERLKKLEEENNGRWKKTDETRINLMKLEQEKHEYTKKTEEMRMNLMRLEEERNEYAKKTEDMRENLRRLEQENNDCKLKAKQQSKIIKQLEDEKTLLMQKSEEQHNSIEKLTELKDLSDGLKAELECPICLDPFDNPYMNPECGHRFCYRCIQQAISKSGKECPLCRVKITSKRGLRKDELIGSITDVVFRDDDECIEIN